MLLEVLLAGTLLALATAWSAYRGLGVWEQMQASMGGVLWGVLGALPPLLTVPLILSEWGSRLPGVRGLRRGLTMVLREVLGGIGPGEAVLLSAMAGLSEEVFFRGVLQAEIGLPLASLIFGFLHPINPAYVIWAVLLGAYLGGAYLLTDSLLVPILIHGLLDFGGIVYGWRRVRIGSPDRPVFSPSAGAQEDM